MKNIKVKVMEFAEEHKEELIVAGVCVAATLIGIKSYQKGFRKGVFVAVPATVEWLDKTFAELDIAKRYMDWVKANPDKMISY